MKTNMNEKQSIDVISQAIDVAFKKGCYSLSEAEIITTALRTLSGAVSKSTIAKTESIPKEEYNELNKDK